jgi:hypothetical protein
MQVNAVEAQTVFTMCFALPIRLRAISSDGHG